MFIISVHVNEQYLYVNIQYPVRLKKKTIKWNFIIELFIEAVYIGNFAENTVITSDWLRGSFCVDFSILS